MYGTFVKCWFCGRYDDEIGFKNSIEFSPLCFSEPMPTVVPLCNDCLHFLHDFSDVERGLKNEQKNPQDIRKEAGC